MSLLIHCEQSAANYNCTRSAFSFPPNGRERECPVLNPSPDLRVFYQGTVHTASSFSYTAHLGKRNVGSGVNYHGSSANLRVQAIECVGIEACPITNLVYTALISHYVGEDRYRRLCRRPSFMVAITVLSSAAARPHLLRVTTSTASDISQ